MEKEMEKEYWIEVNIIPRRNRDEDLLCNYIYPLIHEKFSETVKTWFFFWEPELRLRIRWHPQFSIALNNRSLFSILDEWKEAGVILDWYEGNHGKKDEHYQGEPEMYGSDMWEAHQELWMSMSEFTVVRARAEASGNLTKDREFHWKRIIHLYTNMANGFWTEEARLTLIQALGRFKLLQKRRDGSWTDGIITMLEELIESIPWPEKTEQEIIERWRLMGWEVDSDGFLVAKRDSC